jgi:hypothetical protein
MELEDYSKLPELLGGSVNFVERKNRPVSEMMDARRTDVVENARLYAENPDRPAQDYKIDRVVPYYFCTDSYNGDLKCKTWDEGANITESVQAAIQRYWNYYIFNNFRRGRDEFGFIGSFFGRQNRVIDYLIFPWQFYSFYDAYDVSLRDDLLKASMLGVNFVNQVIGTPEPGLYCQGTPSLFLPAQMFSRSAQTNCKESNTGINLGLGEGRDLYLQFSNDHDFKYEYMGSFFDKRTLLQALFINGTRFFKVLDYSDERRFSINFYRTFREEMLKVMRDVVMGALLNFSVLNNQYQFIQDSIYGHVIETTDNPEGGPRLVTGMKPQLLVSPSRFDTDQRGVPDSRSQVYTPIPYNLALQVLMYASWTNSGRYDQQTDFLEYITVVEEGSGDFRDISDDPAAFNCPEGIAVGAGGDTNPCVVRFTHPMTGQTYRSVQTYDGKSISFELIKLANQYVESEWLPRKLAYEADPSDDNAAYWHEQTDRQLQEFVEMMDYMREMRSEFDVGHTR